MLGSIRLAVIELRFCRMYDAKYASCSLLLSRLSYSCNKQISYPNSISLTDIFLRQTSLQFAGSPAAQKMGTLLWQHTQIATAMQISHIAYAGMTKLSTNTKFQTKLAADNHTSCVSAAILF